MLSWCDTSFRSISRKCYDEEKYSAADKNIDVLRLLDNVRGT